jgi:phage tail-like protein
VLKRGVTTDGTLRDWHMALLKGQVQRRDGMIFLRDESGQDVLAWHFERGLPVKWSGPALNAGSSEASIETLEIAYERLMPVSI